MENKEAEALTTQKKEIFGQDPDELIDNMKEWLIPVAALGVVALTILQLLTARAGETWVVWRNVASIRTTAGWLMVLFSLLIPLAKIEKTDKLFTALRKFPIEVVATLVLIAWIMLENNLLNVADSISHRSFNIHVIYFLCLLLVALCLVGYLVSYAKDIHIKEWQTLRNDSLSYSFYRKYLAVDLKKDQNMRILILIFGQIAVVGGLMALSIAINPWDPLPIALIFVALYLVALFLYTRYKVASVRKDYLRLFKITQDVADGNLDVDVSADLGYFDSLKAELATIQDGSRQAVGRALKSERMKGDLITNVSHDLKTPLTSIITYVDLLQNPDLTAEKKSQYLKTLELKTDRLKTLIEDLFEVSKASSGNLQLDLQMVDVQMLMKQTILGLEDRILASGLILRQNYPKEMVRIQLDGARMHRVFENLIVNMVKYAMPGTRAYIDIMSFEDNLDIIFRNISAQEINVDAFGLSERFVRGETSRTTEGSGLGLSIAKSFTELQGGLFTIAIDGDLFKVVMSFKIAEIAL